MTSKSRLLSSVVNKPETLVGASLNNPSEVNLQALETAAVKYTASSQLPSTGNIGEQAFVEETNRLYIWNGSGWYNIALINTTPTWDSNGQPNATYELSADSPQTATTITLAASDPEGVSINYSYVTGGSMDSIATVSQDSSVFTITPKTEAQAPDGGTGSITFRASDGVNILPQVSSFTLNFISTITNSKYTTLLATADGTSDNNNIADSSSNNHSITVNGDTQVGTFSPYRHGGYSTYFDGTGDNLAISANSAFDFGTGDFTFEMSFYAYVTSGGGKYLITNRASGWGAGVFQFLVSAAATNVYCTFYGYDLGGYTIVPETWYHISAVKSGDTITLYLNGATPAAGGGYSQSHSGVNNVSMGSSSKSVDIGSNGTADYFKGYITDLRIVKGTAITPPSGGPTERLEAVTNTSLLTCHLPYIADGSTNDHSITVNGNTSTKPYSPYDNLEYAAADHGGSVFIEANGGHLSGTLSSGGLGTTFTVEMWIYDDGTGGETTYGGYFTTTDLSSQYGMQLRRYGAYIFNSTTGTNFPWAVNGDPFATVFGVGWHHVAAVHNGSTFKVYVDGKEIISTSDSHTYSSVNYKVGQPWLYLSNSSTQAKAYISDLRINKSVIYSGEFTPPTAPLSSTGAELHIKGTDASIIDKSQGSNLKLESGTTGSTTQVKFANTKSIYFGSPGVGLSTSPPALDGEFTIECWVYFNQFFASGTFQTLFSQAQASGGPAEISTRNNNNTIQVLFDAVQSAHKVTATWNSSVNTWYHLAVVRDSNNTVAIYVDGTALSNVTNSTQTLTLFGHTADLYIGQYDIYNSYPFDGYMQDVRITKGLARYTTNFTPPTASLEG